MRTYDKFICPKCGGKLHREGNSLYCDNRHCYDMAASGYVNLARVGCFNAAAGDSKEMTEARHRIMNMGYYDSLLRRIVRLLADFDESFSLIVDCGCGEGRFAAKLAESFPGADVIGTDLAKSAVNVASKSVKDATFAVANSNNLPLPDGSADVVLCAFTPIFPDEVSRILRTHGVLVTVTPGKNHLWELKSKLYENAYKNEELEFEHEDFDIVCTARVEDNFTVEGDDVRALLQMTPYYYKTAPEAIERLCALPSLTTRLHFVVGIYEKIRDR